MHHRLRTPDGAALYKKRGATIEPINGHLKDRGNLRTFLLRGLHACKAELPSPPSPTTSATSTTSPSPHNTTNTWGGRRHAPPTPPPQPAKPANHKAHRLPDPSDLSGCWFLKLATVL